MRKHAPSLLFFLYFVGDASAFQPPIVGSGSALHIASTSPRRDAANRTPSRTPPKHVLHAADSSRVPLPDLAQVGVNNSSGSGSNGRLGVIRVEVKDALR